MGKVGRCKLRAGTACNKVTHDDKITRKNTGKISVINDFG